MSRKEQRLDIVLEGGKPWGFRLQGGSDFRAPLQIAKVRSISTALYAKTCGLTRLWFIVDWHFCQMSLLPAFEFGSQLLPCCFVCRQVTPGGKADQKGLKDHDYLITINGTPCANGTHNEALHLLKLSGWTMSLTIQR